MNQRGSQPVPLKDSLDNEAHQKHAKEENKTPHFLPANNEAVDSGENSTKNYFILNKFRPAKLKSRRPNDQNGEGDFPQTDSVKPHLKCFDEKTDPPKSGRCFAHSEFRISANVEKNNTQKNECQKTNLGNVEIHEMFHNPLLDYFYSQTTPRLSQSSHSSQNFKLSNILSNDQSNGDIKNSNFKRSSDLNEQPLSLSTHAQLDGNVSLKKEQDNTELIDNPTPIFGDESQTLSRQFAKSELGEHLSIVNQGWNGTDGQALVLPSEVEEKAVGQNLSLPLQRKQNSVHFETECKKKSKSREKNVNKSSVKEDKNSGSNHSSVSDEHLCRAFSVDKSCLNPRKLEKNIPAMDGVEDEQQMVLSMRVEGERTLSLIHDDPEEMDKVNKLQKQPIRSKLQFKNRIFEMNAKKTADNDQSLLRDNPLANIVASTGFLSFTQRKNNFSASLLYKEPSMFSTQDSRPSKQNKSLNAEKHLMAEKIPRGCLDSDIHIQGQCMIRSYHAQEEEDECEYEEDMDIFDSQDHKSEQCGLNDSRIRESGTDEQRKLKRASTRKSHPVANLNEYRIDINSIVPDRKTVMIKNIPNRYTKEMMIELINKRFAKRYDFFYLPIDFERDANVGYAFINFADTDSLRDFFVAFHGTKWPIFNSDKVCNLSYARIQGVAACTEHFQDSSLMKQNVS